MLQGKLQPTVNVPGTCSTVSCTHEPEGKVAPAHVGSTFRRVVGTTLAAFDKELMSGLTGDMQPAVGRPASIEHSDHILQTLLEEAPDLAVLQFYAVNVFNNMSRVRVLDRVREVAAHLLICASGSRGNRQRC